MDVMGGPPAAILDHEDKDHYRGSRTENSTEPEFLSTVRSSPAMLDCLPPDIFCEKKKSVSDISYFHLEFPVIPRRTYSLLLCFHIASEPL